ncbi:NAD(P)H-dependent oxidoreductase [Urechidicola croceus]|uniref:NAD(P)H-dependent oxidoreductase n=2 Tax=Urechidicola croceus TaxID=1850246 RepID=A0A1D8PBR1_9FLAO|nr:NAD(P)H-dependent oxidoreductase [Urechidicola croceus]
MNSIEKLKWRYATKKFDSSKKLSETQINTLINTFNLTATSYGLQPLKMLVISNENIKKQLLEYSFNQSQVVDCSHLLVICIKTKINADYIDQKFDLEKKIRGTSEEIIGDFRAFLKNSIANKSIDEIENSAINQAYIALGNLMTVCAYESIDSCPMEGFIPSKYDEILKLEEHSLKSVLLLPVGFRAEDDFMSALKKVRIPIEESIINIE